MKKSIRLKVIGSIQGIFYRGFVKEHADKHNVKGYVRNLDDGNFEIFIEGDENNVDSMISLCKRGPQHSQIRSVSEKEEAFQDFKEFTVLKI